MLGRVTGADRLQPKQGSVSCGDDQEKSNAVKKKGRKPIQKRIQNKKWCAMRITWGRFQ